MRFLLLVCLLFALLHAARAHAVVGSPAPELAAKLLDRPEQFRLSAHRDKAVIVNFWATWCTPCLAEMPALQAYYAKHKAEGLEILAISMNESRDLTAVRAVAKNFSFPIAMKSDSDFKGLGRIWRMPSTFVVDKQGVLRKHGSTGEAEVTLDSLESLVTPMLSER